MRSLRADYLEIHFMTHEEMLEDLDTYVLFDPQKTAENLGDLLAFNGNMIRIFAPGLSMTGEFADLMIKSEIQRIYVFEMIVSESGYKELVEQKKKETILLICDGEEACDAYRDDKASTKKKIGCRFRGKLY